MFWESAWPAITRIGVAVGRVRTPTQSRVRRLRGPVSGSLSGPAGFGLNPRLATGLVSGLPDVGPAPWAWAGLKSAMAPPLRSALRTSLETRRSMTAERRGMGFRSGR